VALQLDATPQAHFTNRVLTGAQYDLVQVEDGSLYPALTRMLKAGWLTAEWGLSARGRKVRTYRITSDGRKQLEREVSGFKQMMEGIARVMRTAEP
jgi:DNA-binding PadR family transcriptional regulator